MSKGFVHNDLRFWVRMLYDMSGIDVRYMVPDYEDTVQATAETIEQFLMEEDNQNLAVMESLWMYKDRALEAISMRENDGYNTADSGRNYYSDTKVKRSDSRAYIGLARNNAEKSKGYLFKVPLNFEAVARNPEQDAETVKALNVSRNSILNDLNYEINRKNFISDGHDFGSGILFVGKEHSPKVRNHRFLRDRARQNQPLTWEEYERFDHTLIRQKIEYIPTFELIRDRRARGEESMDFEHDSHTIITWMKSISVTDAMMRYPKFKDKIKPGISDTQLRSNPTLNQIRNDHNMTTIKHTWIPMPVRYVERYQVDVGGGVMAEREQVIERRAWVHVVRLEHAGIVEAAIDEYDHGMCPLTMWFRRPSKLHAYGIGAFKDMHSPEWAFNLAFNGKFKYFKSTFKNTKFTYKGVLTEDQVKETKKEGTVIEIDPKALPSNLKNLPMANLIYEAPVGQFPSMYDNLEQDMIYHVDRQGEMVSNRQAYSGRQEALQNYGNETTMSPIVGNLEAAVKWLGEKFYSNLVSFIGDKPFQVTVQDPITKEYSQVAFNEPLGQYEQMDPITRERSLYTYAVKNGLKNLQFDTQISTTSIIPVNPTEQRFWIQETMASLFPYTQSPKGVVMLRMMDQTVYGGMFREWIDQMQAIDQQMMQAAQQNERANLQLLQEEKDREYSLKLKELEQNAFRLQQKAESDQDKATAAMMNAMVQFMNGDANALDGVLRP
jgi:hypothetical protein